MIQPIVGILPDFCLGSKEKGYSAYNYYALRQNYVDAINQTQASALIFTYNYQAIEQYLSLIDGLLIVGGNMDIHPNRYQEPEIHPKTKLNLTRENFEFRLVSEAVKNENADILVISAAIEADIAQLESYEDRKAFLSDLGLEKSGVEQLIIKAYSLLNLITYFTAGVKEVRAWTIHIGDTAPQAAGVIHSDFEKGFIRAEVIAYEDFAHYGSEAKVKEAGKLRVEGKEYIVKDGDVMHFRFNV
jgi:hypothetical protein